VQLPNSFFNFRVNMCNEAQGAGVLGLGYFYAELN